MFSRCHLLPLLRRAVLIREFLVSLLFLTLLLPAQAATPSWWAPRGVIVSGKTSDDFAAINQGQLKYLVSAAVAEMNAKLTGGAGSTLNGVVNAWTTNTAGADDYAVVTVGQLKAVAKPVYERLLAAGAISSLPTWVNGSGSDDFAVANIGQAKSLFAFEVPDQGSNDLVTPTDWKGSEWTSSPFEQIPNSLPPAALSPGLVKDPFLKELISPSPSISPYLERRYAICSTYWLDTIPELWYALSNDREEGQSHPIDDTGPNIWFSSKPNLDSSNLSDTWESCLPQDHQFDFASNHYVSGSYHYEEWSKVRLTMPPGWSASYKIIREYQRSDEVMSQGPLSAEVHTFVIDATSKSAQQLLITQPIANVFDVNLRVALRNQSRALSPSDAAGPRYRKIGLNGVPQSDSPPQNQEENDIPVDETYVDAYTRGLRHSVTDIWSRAGASEIPLSVRRTSTPEIWSWISGLRPPERADRPFGAGYTSNITPNITFIHPSWGSNQPFRATVVDENGSSRSFVMIGSPNLGSQWIPALDEKQDAKTCFDRLVKVEGGWELHKKYGTVCRFEMIFKDDTRIENFGDFGNSLFGGGIVHSISSDRVDGSYSMNMYEYGRMTSVEDRMGNQLHYEYPEGIEGLIPWKIYDPDRPSQVMYIEQNDDGRVVNIRGPSGETVHYSYDDVTERGVTFNVLDSVQRGDGPTAPTVHYTYEYTEQGELDADPTIPNAGLYGYIDLASITDERGNTHAFEYEFATQCTYHYSNGYKDEDPWMKRQSGVPRLMKTMVRPNLQTVEFSGDRSLQYLMNGTVVTNGITTTVTSPSTGTYTYTFTQPQVFCPVPLTAESSQSVIVSFAKMSIASAAGTEYYEFDPEAAMALKRVEDLSGNVTVYTHDDAILSPPSAFQQLGLLNFDDPTSETKFDHEGNPINATKHYVYEDNFRLLKSVTDELGTVTDYVIDENTGLRTQETVTDASDEVLRVTRYEYDDPTFAGFMTRQVLETTGLEVPNGIPAPIGELRTDFVPDENGRIRQQIVYAGEEDDPVTVGVDESLPLITCYSYTGGGSKKTVTDPRRHTTAFEYEPDTLRLKKVIYPDLTFKELQYDAHGNLEMETDELGVKTFYSYDDLNRRVKSTVDLNGDGVASARYTALTPGDENTPPVYNGDLVSETTYNDFNLPVYETDARGIRTFHEYDAIGRRIRTTVNCDDSDPALRLVTRYVDDDELTPDWVGGSMFDNAGFKPLRTIDARGFVTEYEYDNLYRPTQVVLTDTSYDPPQVVTSQSHYDAVGNVIWSQDPLGNITETEYDGLSRAIRVVLPSTVGSSGSVDFAVPAGQRTMKYTPSGQVWSSTDEMGNTTLNFYDNAGRATVTMMPGVLVAGAGNQLIRPQVWQSYDAAGNVLEKSDPLGNITETNYDIRNRPFRVIFPEVLDAQTDTVLRPETESEYDNAGRVIKSTDPLGQFTLTRYDRAGRVYATIAPPVGTQTHVTTSTHDAAGNILTVTNAENQTVTNTYDGLGRLTTTLDAEAILNQFAYDKAGNRTSVKDGLLQETTFTYDAQNRLTSQTFANFDSEYFTYNAVNKISHLDAKNVTTHYFYDVRNRLRKVSAPDLERFSSYDNLGRLLTVTETGRPEASVSYTYDALGRMTSESSFSVLHTYGYDVAGNRLTATYGTGRAVTTTYDALNRPASITEAGRTTYYGYDLAGRALKMISGNGQVTKNVYDELGRLTNRTLYASATDLTETGVLAKFGWGHDAVSNVTAHLEQWKANALRPAGDRTTGMTYDEVNRLKTETINDPTSGITVTSYEYDDANNRSSKTVTGATDPGYWTYDYNEANQLESWAQYTELSGTLLKSAGFVYDSNGNRTSQSVVEASVTTTTTYAWNAQDRLTGVTMPDGTEHGYLYDYRARRVETTRTGGSLPAQTTAIVFAGGLSLAEYESTVPAPIAVQSPTVHYLRGPDMGGGVGGMLYSIRGSTLRYSLSNGRGDIIAQSDENAALTWTASYEAYGKRPAETGTNEDKQRANSKDEDPTGLLNEGFRYRDLETGVWLSRDPAGFVDGPNLYAYVKQNPWTSFDPNGLWSWSSFGKGALYAAVGVVVVGVAVAAIAATGGVAAVAIAGALEVSAATAATAGAVVSGSVYCAAAAYGGYQTGVAGYEAVTGEDHASGAQLSDERRSERAGEAVIALATLGLAAAKAKSPTQSAKSQEAINQLIANRAENGLPGAATTSTGTTGAGTATPVRTSTPQSNGTTIHAEPQTLADLNGSPNSMIAVDQMPCPNCQLAIRMQAGPGTSVVVPQNPAKPTLSPKTAAVDAAAGKANVVPREVMKTPTYEHTGARATNDDD
ncbi:MAG: hypothetical protein OJI67_10950 [Prosthecobacter sp.]|nr:hypothetical protein [Prosthecobacter sp.]